MQIKRLIAFSLSVALAFALVGCKNVSGDGSSNEIEYITQEEIVYVGGESSDAGNTESEPTQQNASTTTSGNNQSQSSTVSNNSSENSGVNPEDYRGTTVKFAVTSDPRYGESGPVIEAFEEKYGITVEPVIIGGDFITELNNLILAGESPDVTRSNGDFPAALSYLQSLDAAKLDYSDPIWRQEMFELTTFGGSPYLCSAVGNVYEETDIVIYRKDILDSAECKTPEQYDAEGKWNIDAFFEIARKCAQKVDGVKGCSFLNRDSMLHMTGDAVFKIENGKFVSGINDNTLQKISRFSDAIIDDIITFDSTNGIVKGTVAIATHHSYALRKTGAFLKNEDVWNKLGFYYLPDFDENTTDLKTGIFRGWGIIQGAQNPVAAGLFLRFYLDSNNFDLQDMYISPEASKFFFNATSIEPNNWNPYFTYGEKNQQIAGIDFYDDVYSSLSSNDSQISNKIRTIKSKIDTGCENLNKYITQKVNEN